MKLKRILTGLLAFVTCFTAVPFMTDTVSAAGDALVSEKTETQAVQDVYLQAGSDADKLPTEYSNYDAGTLRTKYSNNLNTQEYTRKTLLTFSLEDLAADTNNSKTVQSLAGEYGLEFPEDFTELEQERREENEQRAVEVSEGGTVYGPIEYGEYEYYSYRFGNLEEELKQKLRENVFTFSDEELKAAYDGMGEGYFDRGYRGEARVYVTVRTESAEEAGGQSSETLRVLFDEIREQLLSGKTPDADAVSEKYGIRVNMYEYSFEGDSAFKDNDQMQQVMEIYGQLAPGEVSGMYNVMGYDCIVQCISKEDLGVSTWEENREFLIRHCLEEKYEKYMEEQCREAEIAR